MEGVLEKTVKKNKDYFYFAFRVIVGLMFMQHGAQKLFGFLGGNQVELMSLMGLAGTIEFFGGLLIAVGLFTRIVAGIGAIEMLTAFYMAHIPKGFIPIMNGGETAVLFFAAFLVMIVHGAKKWGLDNYFKR